MSSVGLDAMFGVSPRWAPACFSRVLGCQSLVMNLKRGRRSHSKRIRQPSLRQVAIEFERLGVELHSVVGLGLRIGRLTRRRVAKRLL